VRKAILILPLLLAGALLGACTAAPSAPATSSAPGASASASAPGATDAAGGATCTYTADGQAARPVALPPQAGVPDSGTADASIALGEATVRVTLDRAATPCTVNSFLSLARQGFYDGTACHRLVDGPGLFVLQCGDPTGTGSGGPGYAFDDELTGSETYPAGTLAMANAGPGTNGSQFFFVYAESQLPPNYTVFGHTDAAGVAVVASIAAGGQDGAYPDGSGRPVEPATIVGVTEG